MAGPGPKKHLDLGPRIVRAPVNELGFIGRKFWAEPGRVGDTGDPVEWWFYEDLRQPLTRLDSAVGVGRDQRADNVWLDNRAWGGIVDKVPVPPSQLFRKHVYGRFFDDAHGLRNLDAIGEDNVTYECDYPHSDSTFPNTKKIASEQTHGMAPAVVHKIMRCSAIRMLKLRDRFQ